ncbi:MAG: nucleotidyltransferase [Methanobrevibacter thaueri]|nr:nucleotidyltransferase [Methanobrevibacter thaueri]
MIYTIEEIKHIAIPIVSEYGIAKLGIFGSYARGEANENSDLDFIMDTDGLIGMIQYCAIIRRLEEEFGCHVDLITTGCSDREFLSRIQNEEVLIYER